MKWFLPDIYKLKRKKNVRGLIRALSHRNDEIRRGAAYALSVFPEERVVRALLAAARDNYPRVKIASIGSLEAIAAQSGGLLLAKMKSASSEQRGHLSKILLKIPDKPAVAPLLEMLKDPDPDLRWRAAELLGKAGGFDALAGIYRACGDSDKSVRYAAVKALGEAGGPDAFDYAHRACDDSEKSVRYAALETLGRLGDERALGILVSFLKNNDSFMRAYAIDGLGALGDARAVKCLSALVCDPDDGIRRDAINALGAIGGAEAVQVLVSAICSDDEKARARAMNALYAMSGRYAALVDDALVDVLEQYHNPDILKPVLEYLKPRYKGGKLSEENMRRILAFKKGPFLRGAHEDVRHKHIDHDNLSCGHNDFNPHSDYTENLRDLI